MSQPSDGRLQEWSIMKEGYIDRTKRRYWHRPRSSTIFDESQKIVLYSWSGFLIMLLDSMTTYANMQNISIIQCVDYTGQKKV